MRIVSLFLERVDVRLHFNLIRDGKSIKHCKEKNLRMNDKEKEFCFLRIFLLMKVRGSFLIIFFLILSSQRETLKEESKNLTSTFGVEFVSSGIFPLLILSKLECRSYRGGL